MQFTRDEMKCLHKHSKCCRCRSRYEHMHWWLNDCWNIQCSCPVLLIWPMLLDSRSWMLHGSSFSGWCREHVFLVFDYKGSQYIKQRQWCTEVNILQLSVGYLNETVNRTTRIPEPEFGTDGSNHTRRYPRVDGYGSEFGSPRRSSWGFWTGLEANWTIFVIQTPTAGRLPGRVDNTKIQCLWQGKFDGIVSRNLSSSFALPQVLTGSTILKILDRLLGCSSL